MTPVDGVNISNVLYLHRRLTLERIILAMAKQKPAKVKAAKDARAVRVYVALLKSTDPYKGSKTEREHKKGGK